MRVYLYFATLILCSTSLTAHTADENHPLRNAKVGDYATYKIRTTFDGSDISGHLTQTVTSKSDKEIVLTQSGKITSPGHIEQRIPPGQEVKIDLTKPYDPTKFAGNPSTMSDVKIERLKEGKEKVIVGGKEYDANWTTYRLKGKVITGLDVRETKIDFTSEVKVWMSKDFSLGPLRTETTSDILGKKVESIHELIESGNKPPRK